MKNVVSSDEGVAVVVLQLAFNELLRLFHGDVHIPVDADKNTYRSSSFFSFA